MDYFEFCFALFKISIDFNDSALYYQILGIGFLREWQRLNVAITRAKFAIWIVGHAETLTSDPEWKNLIDFMKEKRFLLYYMSI